MPRCPMARSGCITTTNLSTHPALTFRYALTGISVQGPTGDPVRFSTYRYDTLGRAISSEHAGGVNRYSVNYAIAVSAKRRHRPARQPARTLNLTTQHAMFFRPLNRNPPALAAVRRLRPSPTTPMPTSPRAPTSMARRPATPMTSPATLRPSASKACSTTANCAAALSTPPAGARVDQHPMASRLAHADPSGRTQAHHHQCLQRLRRHLRPDHRLSRRSTDRSGVQPYRTSHHR